MVMLVLPFHGFLSSYATPFFDGTSRLSRDAGKGLLSIKLALAY
jgi:hypothetical protein